MWEKEKLLWINPLREENSLVQIDRLTQLYAMQGTQMLNFAGQYLVFNVHTKAGVIFIFRFLFLFSPLCI